MTVEDFKAWFPDVEVDDHLIARYIKLFEVTYKGNYGDAKDYLYSLFVAHRVTVAQMDEDPIMLRTSRAVHGLSVSGTVIGSDSDGDFAATRFGSEFFAEIMLYGGGGMVAGPHYGG